MMNKTEKNNALKPTLHEDFLKLRFPDGKFPANLNHNNHTPVHGTMKANNNSLGGVQMDNKYITKDVFEQFEKRIDDKLDSLPDRMADKMDAKISKFEARQTKCFVGVGVGLIGVLLKVFGII
ncbi:hypothetical protein [Staphylococcus lugdunensis]|nr:hypothetical protein [Staphylococcus lugdunensis]